MRAVLLLVVVLLVGCNERPPMPETGEEPSGGSGVAEAKAKAKATGEKVAP